MPTATLSEFIDLAGITATVEKAASNPNMADSQYMTQHFLVTLHRDDQTMSVPFSGGELAFANRPNGQPSVSDVLECLRSDASSSGWGFGDWCSEYGMEEDESAHATWQVVEAQTDELRSFLGADLFADLLAVKED